MADDAEPATPSPSSSKPIFHQPNPHPYPIKTTSTGILSRSNSTTKSTSPYQYYVPQSPRSPNNDGQNVGMERRGGRHKYGKSLTSDLVPSPLPVPPAENGHGARSDSRLSLPSDAKVFGGVAAVEGDKIAEGRKPRRATVSAPEGSIAGSGTLNVNDGDGSGRQRTYRTLGRRTGGKVKGMVASFERSEDSDSDGGPAYVRWSSGRRRQRSGSNASDQSAGSSSSFSTASSALSPPDVVESTTTTKLKTFVYKGFTSERHAEKANDVSDEPTMEQLLACTPWDDLTSQLHGEAGIGDDNVETIKLRDAGVGPGTGVVPDSKPTPPLSSAGVVETTVMNVDEGESTELTIEQLLALAEMRGEPVDGVPRNGADAWVRVVGSTVRQVEMKGKQSQSRGSVSIGTSRRGREILSKKDEEADGKKAEVVQEPSLPTAARRLKLDQEMSETMELVRTLSARVSRVEARIAEMERVVGQLEVRGRKLAESEDGPTRKSVWRARWVASVMSAFSSTATRKRSWKRYLLYLGLGACALLLREAVRRRH